MNIVLNELYQFILYIVVFILIFYVSERTAEYCEEARSGGSQFPA